MHDRVPAFRWKPALDEAVHPGEAVGPDPQKGGFAVDQRHGIPRVIANHAAVVIDRMIA